MCDAPAAYVNIILLPACLPVCLTTWNHKVKGLIETYKLLNGHYNIDWSNIFYTIHYIP